MSSAIAAVAVDYLAQTGFVVRVSEVGSCWETGGPAWLFPATLLCGILTIVAALWTVESWSSRAPEPGPTAGAYLRGAVSGLLIVVALWVFGGATTLDAISWIMIPVMFLGTAGVAAVAQRRRRALFSGTELTTAWSVADLSVRWGAPALTGMAILGAAGSIWAAVALGHPC